MAATIVNNSYLTGIIEMGYFVETRYIRQLLTDSDSDDPTQTISDGHTDRLYAAMNFGRQQIDALLRGVYPVDSWTSATVDYIVKRWNARYARYVLEIRRYKTVGELTERVEDIDWEITGYARPAANKILSGGRSAQTLVEYGDNLGGVYKSDDTNQFDSLNEEVGPA